MNILSYEKFAPICIVALCIFPIIVLVGLSFIFEEHGWLNCVPLVDTLE
jgi:hypothetical protein